MQQITRSALRYYGAKSRLAKRFIPLMPAHTCYTEAYGGSAGVLLQKPPAKFEVYNDHSLALWAFFWALRNHRPELEDLIAATPHHRYEQQQARRLLLDDERVEDLATGDKAGRVELARLVYVASWQTRCWPSAGGWRYSVTGGKDTNAEWNQTRHLAAIAARLKRVQIECDDARAVLMRYDTPETLHYVDPPYPPQVRSASWATQVYAGEMDTGDHECLASVLHGLVGMVFLSGYRCPLYDELYVGWSRLDFEARTAGGSRRTECLWLNPAATARRQQTKLPL